MSEMSNFLYVLCCIYPIIGLLLLVFQVYLMYLLFKFVKNQSVKKKD